MEQRYAGRSVCLEFTVKAQDFMSAGEASSKIKKALQVIGMPSDIVRRAAVAAYEAEMNLVIHSLGGSMVADISPQQIELVVEDQGPGIDDLELAMKEGFSTASDSVRKMGFGAGMGLPNIKRSSDLFEIISKVGEGTTLRVTIRNTGGD